MLLLWRWLILRQPIVGQSGARLDRCDRIVASKVLCIQSRRPGDQLVVMGAQVQTFPVLLQRVGLLLRCLVIIYWQR